MLDECVIRRPTGEDVYDPATGGTSPGLGEPVYAGKCRVQSELSQGTTPTIGDQQVNINVRSCAIPWGVVDVTKGDHLIITASNDPRMVGTTIILGAVHTSTFVTCRHFRASD